MEETTKEPLSAKIAEIATRDHMLLLFDHFRIGNLLTLVEFLKSNEIPPPKFHLRSWLSRRGYGSTTYPADGTNHYTTCGTTACAVGHGPLAGIQYLDHETWDEYCCRCFCITATDQFAFMFGPYWANEDISPKNNTAIGTAARIEWFLEHGLPEGFAEMNGYMSDSESPWLEGLEIPG